MSVRKRYVFLSLFLLSLLGVSAFFAYRFFSADEMGSSANSRVSFEWLIEPQFYMANDFRSGVAWVQEEKDGPWDLIDKQSEILVENFQARIIAFYSFDTDLASFETLDYRWGYVNLSGDISISPDFTIVKPFRDGMGVIVKRTDGNLLRAVIDHHGKIILPIIYEDVFVLHSKLFVVKKGEKWGYINEKGQVIAGFLFDFPYREILLPDICLAVLDKKAGLLNEKGQWVLPASYDYAYEGREGLIGLVKEGKAGFVDVKGKTVIDFQFTPAKGTYSYTFSEGLAVIVLSDPKTEGSTERVPRGVIDRNGNLLFSFPGYPISLFTNGFLLAETFEGTYELIDRSGNRYPLPSYVEIDDFGQEGSFPEGILRVKMKKSTAKYEKGKYGYLKIVVK